MRKFSFLFNLCVAMMLFTALCGCGGGKTGNSSRIVVGIPQDLEDSLDPHKAVAAGTKEVLFNAFEGLLKPDSQGNIIPAVAESYEILEDGKRYVFKLRPNVYFHNGNLVTAQDVKYSLEKIAGIYGDTPMISAYSLIEDVEINSDDTVTVNLSEPDVDFPAYLAMVNAAIIPADNDADTNPIGTGPYKYVSRSIQENLMFERFDDYWGEKAYIQNVIFKVVPDIDTVVMNLLGGSLNMYAHLSTDQVAQIGDKFQVMEGSMNLVQALYINNACEPFDDVRVRQALCYAIDSQEILDLTSDGKGTIIGSSMFPAFGKYYIPELSDAYPKNTEKAKELLAEAGYPNGFEMTITVPSNYTQHVYTAQVIIEQLKAVGIDAIINFVEWNTWLNDTYLKRNYEATVVGVDASYLTARALLERFYSKADDNFINFSDPDYDRLYEKVITLTDDEEKTKCYLEMERILSEKAANVYIQDLAEFVALSDEYEGYEFYPLYVQDISKIRFKEN